MISTMRHRQSGRGRNSPPLNHKAASQVAASEGDAENVVHIVCRIPSGIVLRLYDEAEVMSRREAHLAGRAVTALMHPIAEHTLKGARDDADFDIRDNRILGCYGVTPIPAAFWASWTAQNADSGLMRHRLIFAEATSRRARDHAAEHQTSRTGFEGLDPEHLPLPRVSAEKSHAGA